MSKTIEQTDSLAKAKDAIDYVLQRIAQDENIRHHMGVFTEAFERLKAAQSALTGISEEEIEEQVLGVELQRKPCETQLREIKALVESYRDGSLGNATTLERIASLLGY